MRYTLPPLILLDIVSSPQHLFQNLFDPSKQMNVSKCYNQPIHQPSKKPPKGSFCKR